jgi:hypothetical protein
MSHSTLLKIYNLMVFISEPLKESLEIATDLNSLMVRAVNYTKKRA